MLLTRNIFTKANRSIINRLLLRHYTDTSVYSRADSLSPEQQLQLLLKQQEYLIGLLKQKDDSQDPWNKEKVETVSRECQPNMHVSSKNWNPDQVLRGE